MSKETGFDTLEERFDRDNDRIYSAVAHWEAARAIARKRKVTMVEASTAVGRFAVDFGVRLVPIGADESSFATFAQGRYGKGTRDPAQLNMGDCFAYACAKTNDAHLLYQGDDFSRTDLA